MYECTTRNNTELLFVTIFKKIFGYFIRILLSPFRDMTSYQHSECESTVGSNYNTITSVKKLHNKSVFRIRIQLNLDPDPAKNLNPDPVDLESGLGSKLFLNSV